MEAMHPMFLLSLVSRGRVSPEIRRTTARGPNMPPVAVSRPPGPAAPAPAPGRPARLPCSAPTVYPVARRRTAAPRRVPSGPSDVSPAGIPHRQWNSKFPATWHWCKTFRKPADPEPPVLAAYFSMHFVSIGLSVVGSQTPHPT